MLLAGGARLLILNTVGAEATSLNGAEVFPLKDQQEHFKDEMLSLLLFRRTEAGRSSLKGPVALRRWPS